MKMPDEIAVTLLAPCGLSCMACYAHVRKKKVCPGCCAPDDTAKGTHCLECRIKNCAHAQGLAFCGECAKFPCQRIKKLDKRYRENYHVNLIENGHRRQAIGTQAYLIEEKARWRCECGGVINLHTKVCSECGKTI